MVLYNAHIFSFNLGEAKRRFHNLKKRFSKKKARHKKTIRSGSKRREAKQAETELKKENTVSNLPNTNVAAINPNDDVMAEAEDNVSDCPKKSLFLSVSTNQSFETL